MLFATEGTRDDILVGMLARLLQCEGSSGHQFHDRGVILAHQIDLSIADEVEPAVADMRGISIAILQQERGACGSHAAHFLMVERLLVDGRIGVFQGVFEVLGRLNAHLRIGCLDQPDRPCRRQQSPGCDRDDRRLVRAEG